MDMDVNIVFIKPTKFEDCMKCIEHIKKDRIVHINLFDLDANDSQRIQDYISGAVYIQEGQIVNPGEKVFCTIPKNKKLVFEYKDRNSVMDSRYDEEEEIIPSYKK